MSVVVCTLADLPEELVRQFAEGEGLLLTGAGVSRRQEIPDATGTGRTRVGVPTAADLIDHFKRRLPPPHPSVGTLEALATAYAFTNGDDRLRRFLKRVYSASGLRPTSFYDRVAGLPSEVREFATTNYDPFLEAALASRRPIVKVVERDLERVATNRPVVYKVHGDAATPESCVITTEDYDRWEREAQQLQTKLAALFLERTVVAVGYGAQDGNLRRLLGTVNARVVARGGQPRPLYIVIPNAATHEFLAYAGRDHNVILVPATGEDFLDWIAERLAARQRAAEADALAILIDPPEVRATRATVVATRPPQPVGRELADAAAAGSAASATSPDGRAWAAHATSLVALAITEATAKRRQESVRTLVRASVAFALGGAPEQATRTLRDAYCRALLVQHDAQLADEIERLRTFPVTGVALLSAPADAEILYLQTLAEVLTGLPVDLPAEFRVLPTLGAPHNIAATGATGAPSRLESPGVTATNGDAAGTTVHVADSPDACDGTAPAPDTEHAGDVGVAGSPTASVVTLTASSTDVDQPRADAGDLASAAYRVARLRAEHAVTHDDLAVAATAFRAAARVAVTVWSRTDASVRAALYTGLVARDGARTAARDELQRLTVPAGAEDLERARLSALGWLAALDGEWMWAAECFENVGASALRALDAVATANALRSAEWAHRQRPDLAWMLDGPGARAARIEHTVGRAPAAPRASGPELRQDAEQDLRRRKTRDAWNAAAAALRLAYVDIDPGNVHRARVTLAEVWTQTLDEGGPHAADEFSVRSAIRFATLVHAELEERDREARAEVLRRTIGALVNPDVRRHALEDVRDTPVSRADRVHATLLLHDLAGLLTAEEVQHVALPLVLAGLKDGWGAAPITNASRAACQLFERVIDRIVPAEAAAVRDALAAAEAAVPAACRDDLYRALALATERAGVIGGEGAALAEQLLGTLTALRALPPELMPHYRHGLGVAIGALVGRTGDLVGERLRAAVNDEAARGYRDGLAVVAVRGEPVAPGTLDGYLAGIAQQMRALARPADPGGFGAGLTDDRRLTQRASVDASLSARHDAIDAALALFAEDRQREIVRAPWIQCAVRLARGTPERLPEILSAFLRLSGGAYEAVGGSSVFSTHPLSQLREIAGVGVGLRARALRGAGALWAWAAQANQQDIQRALDAAARDPDPHVRHGAALAIADVLAGERRKASRDSDTGQAPDGGETTNPLASPESRSWLLAALVLLLADPVPEVRHAARVAARVLHGQADA